MNEISKPVPARVDDARITRGAMWMRVSRQRRRGGVRCFTIEVLDAEIDRLVALGYLRPGDRIDRNEVVQALYRFLDASPIGCAHP